MKEFKRGFINIQLFAGTQDALSILLQTDPTAKDKLKEEIGKVIENFEKSTISSYLKNTDLSGNPEAGSVEARRFANCTSKPYGTARSNRAAEKMKVKPVIVPIDTDDEFLEEVEEKDLIMYGIPGLIERRIKAQGSGMKRLFERRFFKKAYDASNIFTPSAAATTIDLEMEEVIQRIETTKNDFIDGVERDFIALILTPAKYGAMRKYLDETPSNPNVNTAVGEFGTYHGVTFFSSVYLPDTVSCIALVIGSIAQPIRSSVYNPTKIELSDATAFGQFLYSGTKDVTPELIYAAGDLGKVTITSAYGGAANKSTITVSSDKSYAENDFYYLAHATKVDEPVYGEAVGETWTKLILTEGAATLTLATETKIRVAEADASGRIIKVSAETTVVKTG